MNINDLKDRLNNPKVTPAAGPKDSDAPSLENFFAKGSYSLEKENWYSAKPYGFKTTLRNGQEFVMFLPISPSNLQVTTHFATNVIATLYGTVEEHSDIRYYDISIEGTTGMAPKFVSPMKSDDPGAAFSAARRSGRSTTSIANSINGAGFFSKTLALANQIKNKAADLLDGGPKAQAGITTDNSGYAAFHNLYRFLLKYKEDTAGNKTSEHRHSHPLTFFNYKDNNQYNVVVRGFTLRRSADNPMLYNYSIQLRAYNLRDIGTIPNDDLTQRLQDLGLAGVDGSSLLGDIKSLSSQAKGIVGSLVGGINVLGR